jgi:hypothetical protein
MQSISFRDLFDHVGAPRMTFSKRAEAPESYATFLRLGNAAVATGLKPGLLSGKRN